MPRVETKSRLSLTKGWGLALLANINICVESLKYDVFARVEVLKGGEGGERGGRRRRRPVDEILAAYRLTTKFFFVSI